MLFIDRNSATVVKARTEHVNKVSCRIRRRIRGTRCGDHFCEICNSRTRFLDIPSRLFQILNDDVFLEMIVGGLPNDLITISEMIWTELFSEFTWEIYDEFLKARNLSKERRSTIQHGFVSRYEKIYLLFFKLFDYDVWFLNSSNSNHYDAYSLAFNLNRNTCTYCNRLYTSTIKTLNGKKVMRPTFDHWFSHSKYPFLGLSFYNLIPSCSVCNSSIKGGMEFLLTEHLHPYLDLDVLDSFEYDYNFINSTQKFDVFLRSKPNSPRVIRTINDLKLKEMFNAHQSELADLILTKEAYSEKYIDNMVKAYGKIGLSHKEVYRLAFGVMYDEGDFHKRPLSKFKKDILNKFKMTKF